MDNYFSVHIPPADDGDTSNGAVFRTLNEAFSFVGTPEAKKRGGRFKRFQDVTAAEEYAKHGDHVHKESTSESEKQSQHLMSSGEPSISAPSVNRIQCNVLKRAIEQKDFTTFKHLVGMNLRYLVNTSSDTPTVIVEGFRYNALHVAARVGNVDVVCFVLNRIVDLTILRDLYGTSENDVKTRSSFLLDGYLNMPDKGANETPLHIASKFGYGEIVRLLVSYKECEKNIKNKDGKIPVEIRCSRHTGNEKEKISEWIKLLLSSSYIPLYRATDDPSRTKILPPGEHFSNTLKPDDFECSRLNDSILCEYLLSALAGPFSDEATAQKFYEAWIRTEKNTRIVDPLKGAERVGRMLAKRYSIRWLERWKFATDLINLNSREGLNVLNFHLQKVRSSMIKKLPSNNEEPPNCTDISASVIKIQSNTDDHSEGEKNTMNYLNDSLLGLTDRMMNLRLDDSSFNGCENVKEDDALSNPETDHSFVNSREGEEVEDEEIYFTPPSSPEPVYLMDKYPSKEDDELLLALSLVDKELISQFFAVSDYMRKMQHVPEEERARWPLADSPRAKIRRSKCLY